MARKRTLFVVLLAALALCSTMLRAEEGAAPPDAENASASSSSTAGDQPIIKRTLYKTVNASFRRANAFDKGNITLIVLCYPVPESDAYQDISLLGSLPGEFLRYRKAPGGYHRRAFRKNELDSGTVEIAYNLKATLYDISVDFNRIKRIFPYDKTRKEYERHTGARGKCVVPDHSGIQKISRELGEKAENDLHFARLAYEYVAENFIYVPQKSGEKFYFRVKELDAVLKAGEGNCGDLASVFISLLRARGIPARHVSGYTLEGKARKRAEFYLERYGWIPVDPAGKVRNSAEDHFGRVAGKDALIVVAYDLFPSVRSFDKKHKAVREMHTAWYFWKCRDKKKDNFKDMAGEEFTVTIE